MIPLQPTKRTPLYKQLKAFLLEQIQSKTYLPNQKLPPEMELSAQFGVSRITVRGALMLLVEEGLIYRIQGRGSYVSEQAMRGEPVLYSDKESSKSKPIVAVLIPSLKDTFAANLLSGAEAVLSAAGYQVSLVITHSSFEYEKQVLSELKQANIEGIIIFPSQGETYNEEVLKLAFANYPIVVIDRYLRGVDTHCVCADHYAGAFQATEYFIERGHKRIAYLTSKMEGTTSLEDRYKGFEQALAKHHIPTTSKDLIVIEQLSDLEDFLRKNKDITAILAADESQALMPAARNLGLQIPHDLSIIIFDDVPFPEMYWVTPTVIDQQEYFMGQTAANLVLSVIKNPTQERKKVVLPVQLIERDSVRRIIKLI